MVLELGSELELWSCFNFYLKVLGYVQKVTEATFSSVGLLQAYLLLPSGTFFFSKNIESSIWVLRKTTTNKLGFRFSGV